MTGTSRNIHLYTIKEYVSTQLPHHNFSELHFFRGILHMLFKWKQEDDYNYM